MCTLDICAILYSNYCEFCVENSKTIVSYPFFYNLTFLFCFFFFLYSLSRMFSKRSMCAPMVGHIKDPWGEGKKHLRFN